MKPWRVVLKFPESSEEKELALYDAKSYFGGYLKIKRSYFNELVKAIKISKKYSTGRAIEKVISPNSDEDYTFNPWMLLLIKDNEKNKPFWFFIKREKDLSGLLVAIGPKAYADYNKGNSDAKREIKKLINYLVSYLDKFNCAVLLPNFLA